VLKSKLREMVLLAQSGETILVTASSPRLFRLGRITVSWHPTRRSPRWFGQVA